MKGILRTVGFFALSLVVGEIVRRLLTSRAGEAVTEKLGHPELATHEGASAAAKEAKRAIGLIKGVVSGEIKQPERPNVVAQPGWVGIARDASELLLAAGAVLKTASDFVSEDEKLRRRVARRR
jgi:hypothetical protein